MSMRAVLLVSVTALMALTLAAQHTLTLLR
jgi:hypothetical protein